jgi:DNA-binding IclR family transcriptional regulator
MSDYSVPPVTRALKVLRHVSEGHDCANTSRTAKDLGINRTTLLRLLQTLSDERMIEPAGPNGGYVLGTGLIALAARALFSRDIVQVSQPILKRLAGDLGLSAHLGVFDGHDILYLLRETPNLHLVSNVRVGSRLPVHATTIGRIILAYWPADRLAQAVANMDLAAVTSKTSTTPEALIEQLAGDRTLGIAWSVGNFESGIGSAAAAVFDSSGAAIGAINVTGPEDAFRPRGGRRPEISAKLMAAAVEISQQLGHFPNAGRAAEQRGQKK